MPCLPALSCCHWASPHVGQEGPLRPRFNDLGRGLLEDACKAVVWWTESRWDPPSVAIAVATVLSSENAGLLLLRVAAGPMPGMGSIGDMLAAL